MNIEVKGSTYELNLGFRFSNALDKVYKMNQDIGGGQTMEIGAGVMFLYSYLQMYQFDAIVNFYKAGLVHHKKRPSEDDLIEAIEEMAKEDGLQPVAEEAIEGLREAGFYRHLFENEEEAPKKK